MLHVERHPNADRLLLVKLDYGEGREITVVTGAPNLKPGDAGQIVVLARVGARLYDGHKEEKVLVTLKKATLRGIKNDSMVCSEKELGISDESDGIIILPDDAPVGAPLVDYLGDAVLEVAILPNTDALRQHHWRRARSGRADRPNAALPRHVVQRDRRADRQRSCNQDRRCRSQPALYRRSDQEA